MGDLGTAAKGRRRRGCTGGAANDGGRMRGRGADERSDEALISDRDNDPERKAISLSLSLSALSLLSKVGGARARGFRGFKGLCWFCFVLCCEVDDTVLRRSRDSQLFLFFSNFN